MRERPVMLRRRAVKKMTLIRREPPTHFTQNLRHPERKVMRLFRPVWGDASEEDHIDVASTKPSTIVRLARRTYNGTGECRAGFNDAPDDQPPPFPARRHAPPLRKSQHPVIEGAHGRKQIGMRKEARCVSCCGEGPIPLDKRTNGAACKRGVQLFLDDSPQSAACG